MPEPGAWFGDCAHMYHVEVQGVASMLEAMESHEFVFGRLMGGWRMPLDVRPQLSIVLLTRYLITGLTPKGDSIAGADAVKNQNLTGGEGGKLDDPVLAVARYDEPGSIPTALPPPMALLVSSGQ